MRNEQIIIQLPIQGRGGEEEKRDGNAELQRMRNEQIIIQLPIYREEAERKGREMAMLVAELQRMRNETQESGIQDEKMTK